MTQNRLNNIPENDVVQNRKRCGSKHPQRGGVMPALNMTKEFDIDKVICVCAKKDLMTFSVASKYIVNNINSRDYVVIVPGNEVASFANFTDKRFSVIDEAIYTKLFLKKLKANFLVESPSSINWYIQQLLKLCAVSEASD